MVGPFLLYFSWLISQLSLLSFDLLCFVPLLFSSCLNFPCFCNDEFSALKLIILYFFHTTPRYSFCLSSSLKISLSPSYTKFMIFCCLSYPDCFLSTTLSLRTYFHRFHHPQNQTHSLMCELDLCSDIWSVEPISTCSWIDWLLFTGFSVKFGAWRDFKLWTGWDFGSWVKDEYIWVFRIWF